MTDQELRDLVASLALDTQAFKRQLAASQEATDRRAAEYDRIAAEAALARKESQHEMAKLDKYMKELGKQIGGIHDKFGKFAEGLMLPSLRRVVRKKFGAESLDLHIERELKDGRHIELDARALVNGSQNVCVIIEVKSNLNQQELDKMVKKMREVREFFPEYRSMTLYGIVAAIHTAKGMEERVYKAGLYLARMADKTFRLDVPKGFVPKEF